MIEEPNSLDVLPDDSAIILVVDDILENLRLLSRILSREGYQVRQAINGEFAIQTVRINPPDLILLDIMMPKLDGYEVCKILKSDPQTQNIPIIFLSALDEVPDKVKAFQAGGCDYITKPFHNEEVLARVGSQLKLYKLSQQLQSQNSQLIESEARERDKAIQLEQTLTQLQRAQAQLIQTEKMASLGQLVAGIAHEINNPINFISGNVDFIQNYFKDLLRIIEIYQIHDPIGSEELQNLYDEIDLNFILKDWTNIITSMKVGATRIQTIVRSLQNFSKLNTSKTKSVNIHQNIDQTLLLLEPRLKQAGNSRSIQVLKTYGDLPKINAYESQIKQVLVNLINNAIDALSVRFSETINPEACLICNSLKDEKQQKEYCRKKSNPIIQITTEFVSSNNRPEDGDITSSEGKVILRIADNGCGIIPEIKNRIFDPFFTTKTVGSGTGLGLSISYQIVVEQHEGKLSYVSSPGEGTEFVIELPVNSVALRGQELS